MKFTTLDLLADCRRVHMGKASDLALRLLGLEDGIVFDELLADSAGCCAFATLIDKSRSGPSSPARFVDSGKNNVGKSAPLQAGYMTRQQNREIVQAG